MDFDKYKNQKPYPSQRDFARFNIYYKGETLGRDIDKAQRDAIKAEQPNALVEIVKYDDAYKTAWQEYYAEDARVKEQFWADFISEACPTEADGLGARPFFGLSRGSRMGH